MPSECIGVSVEECKKIMEEKGIQINKVEQTQNMPKECISMGVSDTKDCDMIAGKVNEERIKNGEKITVDESGKVDYINPEQIEKIADDSEKASQNIEPNLEQAEGMKQEINTIEKGIQEIEEKGMTEESGSNVVDKPSMKKDNEDVSPAPNVVDNDVAPGPDGIVGKSDSGSDSDGGSSEGSSGGDSAGESASITGDVIGSGNKESSLKKIVRFILGI